MNSSSLIGVKKLTLLSKLSDEERTEITETTDLESTTVKELKAQIESLKNERDRALKSNEDASHQVFMADKKVLEMKSRVSDLENQIKELESRPIEVAVETDSKEVANLKDAMNRISNDWSEKYSQLEEQNIKDRRELLQKIDSAEKEKESKLAELKAELEKTKAEYEKKLSEKPAATPADDNKTKFKIYLTAAYDSLKRLTDFTKACGEKAFADKVIELVSAVKNDLEVQK